MTALLTRILVATIFTAVAVLVVGIAVGGHADLANLGGCRHWAVAAA